QYNEWTDRPTLRVTQLLLERLEARHSFTSVARLGSGVSGDVLVNVLVDDVVHDLSSGGAGEGRLSVGVGVVGGKESRMLGQKTFVERAPAQSADAASAAAAINRCVTTFLDNATTWIEALVEGGGR